MRHTSKTIAAAALLLIAAAGSAAAQEDLVLTATGGWFQPSDKDFREIYGGGPVFGLQVAAVMKSGLGFWAGVDFFSRSGEVALTQETVTLRLTPIYGGLRYRFAAGPLQPYIAAGAAYVLYREQTPPGVVDDGAFGVIGQAGLVVRLLPVLHLDFHVRYLVAKAKPVELEEDIGGLTGAVGLAFVF